MKHKCWVAFALVGFVLLAGCGGGSSNPPPGPPPGGNTAPVSVTMTDTPPAGVTVLSFEVTVTRAVLQPGNVNLITTPVEIEVKRLEVEAALLNTFNVPAGTYTSIEITFTNPELTIRNDNGLNLSATCNTAGAICEFQPPVTATVTYSGAPFPLTITASTPLGLLVDVNLANIISGTLGIDFNAAGAIVITRMAAGAGGRMGELEDIEGRVTAKDTANNQFTLQVSPSMSLTIRVDSNTQFEDFNGPPINCTTSNFACVAVGQVVEVDLQLMSGGVLLATKVEAQDNDNEEELEGIIVSTSNLPASFDMVLVEEVMDVAGIDVGNLVRVNLLPGTTFRIDDDNLPTTGLIFGAASDLMVGQRVQVEKKSTPSGTPPAFDTDRVKLKDSRFTARVQSVNVGGSLFIVDNLPGLFTTASPAVTQIEVRTGTGTEFENVSGLSGLAAGNTVSLRGIIFKSAGNPVMVAKKVRKR